MKHVQQSLVAYFAKNLGTAVGLVVIWRGIWHILDWVDANILGGNILWTAVGGIVIGIAILYLPDNDLKELEKL